MITGVEKLSYLVDLEIVLTTSIENYELFLDLIDFCVEALLEFEGRDRLPVQVK
jgi:hypothetical protein